MTGCKFDKQTTYAAFDFEEEVTGDDETLVEVGSQHDVRFTSEGVQQANDAGCLKEEASAVALTADVMASVGADFENDDRNVVEAQKEIALGGVAILIDFITVSYFGNQRKFPGLAAREHGSTRETDDGVGWERTRNIMPQNGKI